ncbi:MAG TPA: class I SAM-dependent methyltransferase [Candidatus Synoicihabitans sp.]|nr:class I SAM-dependent methyltransferase [Candidatus Synoicihabitans sp.]
MTASRSVQRPALAVADGWSEYALLDAGDGMKHERWGTVTLVRPDPQVIWPRRAGPNWRDWDGYYHRSESGGGRWEFRRELPASWQINYGRLGLTFRIQPTSFKHTGLFPEQAVNWEWCNERIRAARALGREVAVLNLFGYTGAATCAAAKAGASVCHVDAAEGMVRWCRENAMLSGLGDASIRYIADDCLKFVRREARRGRRYDAVIMDPPTYGRGSGGEMWRLEDHLWELLRECRNILSDTPLFFLINAYTARLSPTVVVNLLSELFADRPSVVTGGEVGLPIAADGKILPCGIYGRWEPGP